LGLVVSIAEGRGGNRPSGGAEGEKEKGVQKSLVKRPHNASRSCVSEKGGEKESDAPTGRPVERGANALQLGFLVPQGQEKKDREYVIFAARGRRKEKRRGGRRWPLVSEASPHRGRGTGVCRLIFVEGAEVTNQGGKGGVKEILDYAFGAILKQQGERGTPARHGCLANATKVGRKKKGRSAKGFHHLFAEEGEKGRCSGFLGLISAVKKKGGGKRRLGQCGRGRFLDAFRQCYL